MIKHAEFQTSGVMVAASVTRSYQTLLTIIGDTDVIVVLNGLNQAVVLSLPNERGTAEMTLPACGSFSVDFKTNNKCLANGTIKIKAYSDLPTLGMITVTVAK